MNETPMPLRGYRYNTHLTLRCVSFNQCPSCSMCQNYDAHCAICVMCESRKMDGTKCTCTDKQKAIRQELERKMRRPMFAAPGMVAPPMAQGIVNDPEWRKLGDQIREEFTGVGVPHVEHTYTPTDETYKVDGQGDVFRV
jgi:hypothetical protein